jgi:hypothetical protein
MPADDPSSGARLARRRFLGVLAAAPAALAGCASSAAEGPRAAGGSSEPERSGAGAGTAAPDAATAAVRAVPLEAEAEPAFVFRAGAARPGEP